MTIRYLIDKNNKSKKKRLRLLIFESVYPMWPWGAWGTKVVVLLFIVNGFTYYFKCVFTVSILKITQAMAELVPSYLFVYNFHFLTDCFALPKSNPNETKHKSMHQDLSLRSDRTTPPPKPH